MHSPPLSRSLASVALNRQPDKRVCDQRPEWLQDRMAACRSWISSPVAKSCVYGVCAFVLRCFSCSHTVLPKEHSLGVIFFSSPSSCYSVFFLPLSTCISLLIIPCMIVYVTNNKEPWILRSHDGCAGVLLHVKKVQYMCCGFTKFRLNLWSLGLFYQCPYYVFGSGNISVVLLSMEGQKALGMNQKYLKVPLLWIFLNELY